MCDNLIFTGISQHPTLKDFMKTQLKLPLDTINRLGQRSNKTPRLIIAKFEHFKHKEPVKSKGKELKGMNYGLNDQFPREINERHKVLYPIMKQHRQNNKQANIIIDKLYIDRQLYRNSSITPWFF